MDRLGLLLHFVDITLMSARYDIRDDYNDVEAQPYNWQIALQCTRVVGRAFFNGQITCRNRMIGVGVD
jgi:hypothetical protein